MKNYGILLLIILASTPLLGMEKQPTPSKLEKNAVAKKRTHPTLDLQKAILNKNPQQVRKLLTANGSDVLDQLDDALKIANDTADKLDQKAKEQTIFTELKDSSTRSIVVGTLLVGFGLYTTANGVYVPATQESPAYVDWTTLTSNLPTGLAATTVGAGAIYQGVTGRTPEKLKRAQQIIGMLNQFNQSQQALADVMKSKSAPATSAAELVAQTDK